MTFGCDFSHNTLPVSQIYPPAIYSTYFERPKIADTFHDFRGSVNLSGAKLSADPSSIAGKSFLDSPSYVTEQKKSCDAIREIAVHWKKYLFNLSASAGVDELSETIDGVYEAIDLFGPGAINLTSLSSMEVNGEHLAAILRATFPFKKQTPGWDGALNLAIKALERESIPINDALAGLL